MFFKPLKRSENSNIVDPNLVDEIFFQIPEICASHEIFLDQVKNRVNNWSDQQIIGDVFVSSVSCILFCSTLFFFKLLIAILQVLLSIIFPTQYKKNTKIFLEFPD